MPKRLVAGNANTFNVEEERDRRRSSESTDDFPVEYPDSSRVQAFRFVPGEDQYYGNLYVRFVKYGTPWVYYNIPVSVYESFANSPSKGRFINMTLNSYPYSRASGTDEGAFFQEF
jgi:hypothetical protein